MILMWVLWHVLLTSFSRRGNLLAVQKLRHLLTQNGIVVYIVIVCVVASLLLRLMLLRTSSLLMVSSVLLLLLSLLLLLHVIPIFPRIRMRWHLIQMRMLRLLLLHSTSMMH